jgi:hypothetical protein
MFFARQTDILANSYSSSLVFLNPRRMHERALLNNSFNNGRSSTSRPLAQSLRMTGVAAFRSFNGSWRITASGRTFSHPDAATDGPIPVANGGFTPELVISLSHLLHATGQAGEVHYTGEVSAGHGNPAHRGYRRSDLRCGVGSLWAKEAADGRRITHRQAQTVAWSVHRVT